MKRREDWAERLRDYILAVAARPFRPGRFDCAMFVAGALEAMTGVDPAAAFKGRYTTLEGGGRILRRAGFADHVALVAAHFAQIPLARATAGDIAVLPTGDGDALGIVQGEAIYLASPAGLVLRPLLSARTAFEVPR
jgi:hypothetical protein